MSESKTLLWEQDAECRSCGGTGVYVGFTERDGFGVVCSTCRGTGCERLRQEWHPFTGRRRCHDVTRVLKNNPGICTGSGRDGEFTQEDFGGIPYEDWLAGRGFPKGSEMRKFTCPAWWCQSADYARRPDWEECHDNPGLRFSSCRHFHDRAACWERFDREQPEEAR
jgi:hypothetical protein